MKEQEIYNDEEPPIIINGTNYKQETNSQEKKYRIFKLNWDDCGFLAPNEKKVNFILFNNVF